MLKARILAIWGISITLLGLLTPVLAMTVLPQTPDENQANPDLSSTSLSYACPLCTATDTNIPQSTTLTNNGEIPIRLRSGAFDPLLHTHPNSDRAQTPPHTQDAVLHLIQFPGPIQDSWYQAMVKAGLEVVAYVPDYTYLVWGNELSINTMRSGTPLRWSGFYLPQYTLHPSLQRSFLSQDSVEVTVQLYNTTGIHAGDAVKRTTAAVTSRAAAIIRPPTRIGAYINLTLKVATADLAWISAQAGVVSVEPLLHPRLADEIQGQILAGQLTADGVRPYGTGYLTWLTATVGFTTSPSAYPIIDITDDGIDDGDATPNHADFFELGEITNNDRLIYNANWTTDSSANGVGGHGNLNASIAGGYNDHTGSAYEDSDGFNYGLGINPFARIAGSKVFGNTSGWANPVYADVINHSYTQGARISSNSWGDDVGTGQYQTDDQIYDLLVRDGAPATPGNQEMTILFSAGNSGSLLTTIGSPGNAKNVITVGASESFRPTWVDGCWIGTSGADNANDIATFSSRGPTADGRIKPDIVAPGTHIIGAATQIPNYTGAYVCDRYYPPGQTLYAASSGTSHAAPAVAGAASLFYGYYKDNYSESGEWPSPAMTKAAIINSAQYLDGASSGDTLPSPHQGFGAVNLGTAFDGVPRLIQDQVKIFQQTGESTIIRGYISDPSRPFRVTLAWTDAPGAVIGDAYVNDLNLVVDVGEQVYIGNVFAGSTSTSGGIADTRNNVESVFLPAGFQGAFEITVQANNIAGDGVPGNGDPTDQDYALICYNCVPPDTFNFEVNPQKRTICAGQDAEYNVTSINYAEFPVNIDLTASGQPATSIAIFNPNPITAGGISTLTVSNTAQAPAGIYDIEISGETLTRTQVVTKQLQIHDSVPETTTLTSPPDSAYDIPLHPTLSWLYAAQTNLYAVQIATNTGFTNIVYGAVTDKLTHTVQIKLNPETDYYWRVTPQNICGTSMPSETRYFTTQAAPLIVTKSPGLLIPDNDANGIFDTIAVTDSGTLIDMDVAISITHSWVGDLRATLTHSETGTMVNLIDRPGVTNPATDLGCSGSDLDLILDDAAPLAVEDNCQNTTNAYPPGAYYSPNESLSLFNGEAWKGHWTLHVSDNAAMDTGILNQWSLMPTLSTNTDNTVSFSQEAYTVSKNSPAAAITVTLRSTPASSVTVEYLTKAGSAIPGTDYITTTGTLTFVHTFQQTFAVPVLDNPDNEISRTLMISLQNPTNAELTIPYSVPLHIIATKQQYFFYLQCILKRYP